MATAASTLVEERPDKLQEQILAELDELNDEIDDSALPEEDLQEIALIHDQGRQTFTFLAEDPEFQKVLAEGGTNPSVSVDQWAINRLDSFREFKGLGTATPFHELPVPDMVMLLCKFYEQTCKLDGSFYPSETLMALFRGFNRVIRKKQELRILQTGRDEEVLNLKEDILFKPVRLALLTAMQRSRNKGANLPRKKATVISMSDENVILSHACTLANHPRGLQRRVGYYMLTRFCIRGGKELYNLRYEDFSFNADENGPYLRYDEPESKNYKVSMTRFQDEQFRSHLKDYDPDVISSMQALMMHLPTSVALPDRFIFYQAIDSPRTIAWYSSSRVAIRNLSKWLKLIHTECGLMCEGITNKSGRTTCVTRMGVEGVPASVGMLVTGHKNAGAYARYDRSTESKVRAAQKCVVEGTSYDLNVQEEANKLKSKMIVGVPEMKVDASAMVEVSSGSRMLDHVKPDVPIENGNRNVRMRSALSVQSNEEFDAWADAQDWGEVDRQLVSRGIIAHTVNFNPVKAVFGSIQTMNNCNVTINLGGGGEVGSPGVTIASALGSL